MFPFDALNSLVSEYPDSWRMAADILDTRVQLWKDYCLLPSHFWREIFLKQKPEPDGFPEAIWELESLRMTAIATWRYRKNVYRIAPDVEKMLLRTPVECPVPIGESLKLPAPCLFIETREASWFGEKMRGFWAMCDVDFETQACVLRFIIELGMGSSIAEFFPGNWDIRTAIQKRRGLTGSLDIDSEVLSAYAPLVSLLLYVCGPGSRDLRGATAAEKSEVPAFEASFIRNVGIEAQDKLRRVALSRETRPAKNGGEETSAAASPNWRGAWVQIRGEKYFLCDWVWKTASA